MKEITRIHIAKISYDIEIKAKKELEAYLKTLEAYSNDTDIIDDVELRITEILAERGVQKNGVISADDVTVLTQQLGEPREFMDESDTVLEPEDEVKIGERASRKLYRNTDNAIVGGVLSGIAAFFSINPTWIRLLFIVLAFASFGTAILVYIVLWIVVPSARTAADKLQMAGRAVTVQAIRQQNEVMVNTTVRKTRSTRRGGLIFLGILSTAAAITAALTTILMCIAVLLNDKLHISGDNVLTNYLIAAAILAIISGLLLTALFIVAAYASFAQKMTRRIIVSLCIIVVAGLVSFGAAIGLAQYGNLQQRQMIQDNTQEKTINLPEGIENITSLAVTGANVRVQYIATTDQPRASVRTIETDDTKVTRPDVSIENTQLKVHIPALEGDACVLGWCDGLQTVVIYGPALMQLSALEAANVEYQASEQANLTLTAEKNAIVDLSGTIEKLIVTAEGEANVTAWDATVRHLEATVRTSINMRFGAVQTLKVNDLSSCPVRDHAQIRVEKVMSGTMQFNNATLPASTHDSGCTEIEIESEEDIQ